MPRLLKTGRRSSGWCTFYERPALEKPCEAVVQALIVDGSLRKTGVGRILMAAAETCLVLHTRDDREDARAFYEHLGYQKAATSHLMSKALDRPI